MNHFSSCLLICLLLLVTSFARARPVGKPTRLRGYDIEVGYKKAMLKDLKKLLEDYEIGSYSTSRLNRLKVKRKMKSWSDREKVDFMLRLMGYGNLIREELIFFFDLLVSCGVDVQKAEEKFFGQDTIFNHSFLWRIMTWDDTKLLDRVLFAGANPNARKKAKARKGKKEKGPTPLAEAYKMMKRDEKMGQQLVDVLLKHGARANQDVN